MTPPFGPTVFAPLRSLAILGNHMPRQCGIATFTTHLHEAIGQGFPATDCFVLAMTDRNKHYAYPASVRYELPEADAGAYRRTADLLNASSIDVLSLQHEFGIYGGKAGCHLLDLLRRVRMPVVATLHTLLGDPDPDQRAVMDELSFRCERLVVMNSMGARLLQDLHHVPADKIDLIPHGIPAVTRDQHSKARLGLEGRMVILTFGLLAPDKGIEYVLEAMPQVLAQFPEARYLVVGATHPHVLEQDGESYRNRLERRARELGVQSSIHFHNRFLAQSELNEFLAAADIYVTPYLKPEQITSGTLAYAVGCGKAVISTPYLYAKELLADGRGMLVPFRDPQAIAHSLLGLLSDEGRRGALQQRAAAYGRNMLWPAVAQSYMASFERARLDRIHRLSQPLGLQRDRVQVAVS